MGFNDKRMRCHSRPQPLKSMQLAHRLHWVQRQGLPHQCQQRVQPEAPRCHPSRP
jgi:hypothetical protein